MTEGNGLRGMRERVAQFGGHIKMEQRDGGGVRLIVELVRPALHEALRDAPASAVQTELNQSLAEETHPLPAAHMTGVARA